MLFPWRSQKAFISFSSLVERLILKKTSLLLSVTLMFKCSAAAAGASFLSALGLPFSWVSDILELVRVAEVKVLGGVARKKMVKVAETESSHVDGRLAVVVVGGDATFSEVVDAVGLVEGTLSLLLLLFTAGDDNVQDHERGEDQGHDDGEV